MATQTKQNGNRTADYGAERFQELNGRFVDTSRRAGNVYVDSYEKTMKTVADLQERVAAASQNEWLTSMAVAQADFIRELARVQTQTARELLR
ncbi:MAG: hypothetical protein ACR2NV_11490 [Thermoleophilaceae bacterium]